MGVVGHAFQLAVSEFFEFGFGFRLVAFEFLVFQVIPHLFVRIPVGRILGKVEDVKARVCSMKLMVFFETCGGA